MALPKDSLRNTVSRAASREVGAEHPSRLWPMDAARLTHTLELNAKEK